jgi:hypothetical protein
MSNLKLTKKSLPLMMLVFGLCMTIISCSPTVKYVQPPLGEAAVLNLPLEVRPEPPDFSPEEMKTIPRSAHGKILKCLAAWWGYADIAEDAVKTHQDYERSLFTDGKGKKK